MSDPTFPDYESGDPATPPLPPPSQPAFPTPETPVTSPAVPATPTGTPAGWYPQPDGRQRYWDGTAWTDQFSGLPGAGAPAYGPPPAKTGMAGWMKGCLIAAIIGLLVLGGGVVACTAFVGKAANDVHTQLNAEHTVVYEVTGDSTGVSISYGSDANGGLSTEQDVTLPWSKEVKGTGFLFGAVTVQNSLDATGTITCKVTVDGKAGKESTASGPGAVASCLPDIILGGTP